MPSAAAVLSSRASSTPTLSHRALRPSVCLSTVRCSKFKQRALNRREETGQSPFAEGSRLARRVRKADGGNVFSVQKSLDPVQQSSTLIH